ncbi:hypothetical protein BASA81_001852 [Batrachochytrium salamandrivorans]|nr:hypothetical protein BASA81_001852 [Batrachochytrium salamandrivorans]
MNMRVVRKWKWPLVMVGVVILRFVLFPQHLSSAPLDVGSGLVSMKTVTEIKLHELITPKPIEIFLYDVVDPKFHLVDNGLGPNQWDEIAKQVARIWLTASKGQIGLVFHNKVIELDEDRSNAYLFYLFGSPKIKETAKKTNLQYNRQSAQWVVDAFAGEISHVFDHAVGLWDSKREMNAVATALKNKQQLTQSEFLQLAPAFPNAFGALVGTVDRLTITPHSFADFVYEGRKSNQTRKIHLGFRFFYLHCGVSVEQALRYQVVLQNNPMFLLHYAIGRDKSFPDSRELKRDNVDRNHWEFTNTISLFPTFYYHDRNGRGGKNWMDVVFRTASCWDEQNKSFQYKGKEFGKVMCRWGTRDYEQHHYQAGEFARLIAHEIGHCLGLIHNVVRCQVFSQPEQGNLMQQHITFALQQWSGKCKCMTKRCSDCGCPYTNEVYGEVAKSQWLDAEQVELVVSLARALDHHESELQEGCKRVGFPLTGRGVEFLLPLETSGLLLERGEAVELARWSNEAAPAKIRFVRFQPFYVYPVMRSVRLRVYTFKPQDLPRAILQDVFIERRIEAGGPHAELDLGEDGLDISPGESLGMELCMDGNEDKARMRLSVHPVSSPPSSSPWDEHQTRSNTAAIKPAKQRIAINYDVCTW